MATLIVTFYTGENNITTAKTTLTLILPGFNEHLKTLECNKLDKLMACTDITIVQTI